MSLLFAFSTVAHTYRWSLPFEWLRRLLAEEDGSVDGWEVRVLEQLALSEAFCTVLLVRLADKLRRRHAGRWSLHSARRQRCRLGAPSASFDSRRSFRDARHFGLETYSVLRTLLLIRGTAIGSRPRSNDARFIYSANCPPYTVAPPSLCSNLSLAYRHVPLPPRCTRQRFVRISVQ